MSKPKTPKRKQELIINNSKTAQILLTEELQSHLITFSSHPKTIKKAALELGMTIKDLYYHVNKLCAHNLLEVVTTKPRAGRPIKYYRTSAENFIIPYQTSQVTSLKEFAEIIINAFFEAFYHSYFPKDFISQVGIKVHIKNGRYIKFFVQESDGWHDKLEFPKPYNLNTIELAILYLSEKEAKALRQDLFSVFNRYNRKLPQNNSQKLFLFHWGLAKALEKFAEGPSKKSN